MTQDEIIEMARQVGYNSFEALKWEQALTDFAKLVADVATAKEREACAKIADRHSTCTNDTPNVIAIAIRARVGETT